MSKKVENIAKKIFWKKKFFFVGCFRVEILRLACIFWLWGVLGMLLHRKFHDFSMIFIDFYGQKSMENQWFWCSRPRKIMKNHEMSVVGASPAPPHPKTMRQTKYLDPRAFHEKKCFFFQKMNFRNIFHFFWHPKTSIFAIFRFWTIWRCDRPY